MILAAFDTQREHEVCVGETAEEGGEGFSKFMKRRIEEQKHFSQLILTDKQGLSVSLKLMFQQRG
jgi:hypothetical protein